ncbi:MAG TPA: hypothetical protein VE732_06500 [Nitrososphaera sp.]|nr:hypothetical protein [Nitrososphaera sp.]
MSVQKSKVINIGIAMRDLHYKHRTIRLSEEVWESLKVAQKESRLS